jgi:hypothetical protein
MAKNLYQSNLQELTKSIEDCLKSKEKLSCLILLYSTIDIMVWLSRDPHDADSTKDDFIGWVEEFLLPGSNLACSAEDLYSARNKIIHSYAQTWGASPSYNVEANKIHYIWGKAGKEPKKYVNGNKQKDENISLPVENLLNALQAAIQRFNNSLIDNRTLFELIDERSKKFFI